MPSNAAWPLPMGMTSADNQQEASAAHPAAHPTAHAGHPSAHPAAHLPHHHSPQLPAFVHHNNSPTLLTNWPLHTPAQHVPPYLADSVLLTSPYAPYPHAFPSPIEYPSPTIPAAFDASMQMGAPYASVEATALQWADWQEFEAAMNYVGSADALSPNFARPNMGSLSPTGTYLEVSSIPSSSSDAGWAMVDSQQQMLDFQHAHQAAIFNPSQTLHLRSHSDASHSDGQTIDSLGSYEDIGFPPYSPGYSPGYSPVAEAHSHALPSTSQDMTTAAGLAIKASPPVPRINTQSTPASTARRNSGPRKSPTTKATKAVIRRSSTTGKKETEKRVGRRRGPLLPEQRKQASEIRKLRACLRCKFLKKTCDKGDPCAGCQPAHARLWQVPCTRIDIKEIGYFLKDWKADYDRHVGRHITVHNIKGFASKEELIWITHGYGFALPIMAREVYVVDESCFNMDWVEADHSEPLEFDTRTDRMSAGVEGISTNALSEYLDQHLDGPFEDFIDNYFEGTPFITEILKTAHRYYRKEKVPVIRKALKLVLAYNLTLHVTMVEQRGDEHPMEGLVDHDESKFFGKIIAPTMINFQIKCALADMWRELQKEILEELSSLYSSVYSGDRLKNWPTIFMIASILLAVWEEMQFDCYYRTPDATAVDKFCHDMETTPVGVIVGLFHAISQKLPAFTEWETRRHGQLLNNNPAVCDAMTEMREHITKHGK